MTQAKLEPGKTSISLGNKTKSSSTRNETGKEKDVLPELGVKSPIKRKKSPPKASPLDPGIDIDE